MTRQVHENLQHPWEQPVYTMTFIVCCLYSEFSLTQRVFPVLRLSSLVSCPPTFICWIILATGIFMPIFHWKAQKSCTHYSGVLGLNPILSIYHFVPIVSLLSMMHCDISVKLWKFEFKLFNTGKIPGAIIAISRAQNSSKQNLTFNTNKSIEKSSSLKTIRTSGFSA